MTTRIHVLSDGFTSPNGRGVVYPLLAERQALVDEGLSVRIFAHMDAPGLGDCDLLVVDSKQFTGAVRGALAYVLDALGRLARGPRALAWYDSTDSSSWLAGEVLAVVPRYWKSQWLTDHARYLAPLYGRRVYTDYYHRHMGVEDETAETMPQVRDARLLHKLRLGWCSALADYGRWGAVRTALWQRLGLPGLVPHVPRFVAPSTNRLRMLAARIGTSYQLASVAWQRRALATRLSGHVPTDRVGRGQYFAELRASRAVLSPFGLGEICYRDFETFLAGSALVKPDMSHMQTWPDLYRADETMFSFQWDFSDFDAVVQRVIDNPANALAIAQAGQERYRHYLAEPDGRAAFRKHFSALVADALLDAPALSGTAG